MACKLMVHESEMHDGRRLAPEASIVSVQSGTQGPTGHEEFSAGVVIAVCVYGIWEGVDVRKVASPCFVVILWEKNEHSEICKSLFIYALKPYQQQWVYSWKSEIPKNSWKYIIYNN